MNMNFNNQGLNMHIIQHLAFSIFIFTLSFSHTITIGAFDPIELKTSRRIPGITGKELHSFLSTPSNWPRIVLSSVAVTGKGTVTEKPLKRNGKVAEIFGLPPILPLQVDWVCERSEYPFLVVNSKEGVKGIASDCAMEFTVNDNDKGAEVDLTMRYTPRNPIAIIGALALIIDNALAIKVLLPYVINKDKAPKKTPLNEFRTLMGSLYGGAGIAHALDIFAGNSQLFAAAGIPAFQELPPPGKLLSIIWCLSGPLAFALSGATSKEGIQGEQGVRADLGLLQYGLVEVGCAALATVVYHLDQTTPLAGGIAPLPNALIVQALVGASWVYSRGKGASAS